MIRSLESDIAVGKIGLSFCWMKWNVGYETAFFLQNLSMFCSVVKLCSYLIFLSHITLVIFV